MTVPGGACGAACMTGAAGITGATGAATAFAAMGGFAAAVCWMAASAPRFLRRGKFGAARLTAQRPKEETQNDKGQPRQDEPDHPELLGARQIVIAGEIPDEGPHIDQHAGGDIGQGHLGPERGLRENRHRDTPFQGGDGRGIRVRAVTWSACRVPKVTSASTGMK